MADATMLDAPETPAPLFAWRALKGVFLGSPADEEENKENTAHSRPALNMRARPSNALPSSPSPSKRRRINQYSSPAKSILRTPGVPTPRRQKSNVTFKDVRISISPELARKTPSPVKALAEPKGREEVDFANPADIGNVKRKISSQDTSPEDAVQICSIDVSTNPYTSNTATAQFDFESYKASTEKEMKKLMRYGQKMREYARVQDEENAKLRVVLESLRKENEELKKREERELQRLRQNDRPVVSGSMSAKEKPRSDEIVVKTVQVAGTPRTSSLGTQETVREPRASTLDARRDHKRSAGNPTLPQGRGPKAGVLEGRQSCNDVDKRPLRQTSVRVPPERLAAARERVRLKAEERRKASEVGTQSQVDWAGL